MNPERKQSLLMDVAEEMHSQELAWGQQDHGPHKWVSILTEEVGEVAEEALHEHSLIRNELIQVAAVALSFIDSLERNGRCGLSR